MDNLVRDEGVTGSNPLPLRPRLTRTSCRKAFIRKWRLKHLALADSLEEAGERLFTVHACRTVAAEDLRQQQ